MPPKYYSIDQIKENGIGGAWSSDGEWEMHIQGFGGETWGKETTLETQA